MEIVLLIFHKTLAVEVDGSNKLKEILAATEKAISYSQSICSFNPFTIRLIDLEMGALFFPIIQSIPKILGLSDNFLQKLEPERRRHKTLSPEHLQLSSFFTIVYYQSPSENDIDKMHRQKLNNKTNNIYLNYVIERTVSPSLDFLLLIINIKQSIYSEMDSTLILNEFPVLPRLLNKLVLTFSYSNLIWTDPLIFSQGHLVVIPNVPKKPLSNPYMGYNLRGRDFLVAIAESPPFTYEVHIKKPSHLANTSSSPPPKPTFKGVYVDLLFAASLAFNFTYTITNEGAGYGRQLPNGTWIGKYSKIYYADSGYDMVLLMPTHYLLQRGDRSPIISMAYIGFIMGVPDKLHVPWYAFLQPFDKTVWLLVNLTFICLGSIYVVKLQCFQQLGPTELLNLGLFMPLSISLEQSGFRVPSTIRGYVVIWLIACVVLGTAYKSKLRTFLMFPLSQRLPYTFEELADIPEIKITLAALGKIEESFFFESDLELTKKLAPRINVVNDRDSCMRTALFEEAHVCISWSLAKALVAQKMTLNTTVDPFLYSTAGVQRLDVGIGFQQHSIFVRAFELITLTAFEMGFMEKWEDKAMLDLKKTGIKKLLAKDNHDTELVNKLLEIAAGFSDNTPLRMRSLVAVFGILLVGITLAGVVLIAEYLSFSKKRKVSPIMKGETRQLKLQEITNGGKLLFVDMNRTTKPLQMFRYAASGQIQNFNSQKSTLVKS